MELASLPPNSGFGDDWNSHGRDGAAALRRRIQRDVQVDVPMLVGFVRLIGARGAGKRQYQKGGKNRETHDVPG